MEYSVNKLQGNLVKQGIVSAVLLLGINSFAIGSDEDYRYSRYCEVILGKGLKASVYTTFKSNGCPQNMWGNLDVKLIKRQNKASFIYLNGPRYYVFDKYTFQKTPQVGDVKFFGGLKMRKAASVKISLSDIIKGFRPYIEHQVYRRTTWVYQAGKPIYELISPKNKVYIMQSYSDEIVKQNATSLANLGRTLHLPKGWLFKTGILKKDAELITENNVAIVTQDNVKNTYQLSSRDLLDFKN